MTAVGRFYPFTAPDSKVRFPEKIETSKSAAPTPDTQNLPRRAQDPGPARSPRGPDSQFLETFHPRHPNTHAGANRSTTTHSKDRIFEGDFRFLDFQISGGAKEKSRVNTPIQIWATHEPRPERIRFVTDISG